MPANTRPRFTGLADPQFLNVAGTAANTTKDLTSGTTYLVYTSPTDGGLIDFIRLTPLGTNVATVCRVWLNNGSATTTATNNVMIDQRSLPATTNTETAAIAIFDIPLRGLLGDIKAGYRVYLTFGTAVAAGYAVMVASSKWASA